ncbi:F-box protein At3g07870-like [Juglans microcarpa x Juglans regia]|uniref:F-box protein At3g07870-like n=1 Tax=Juglans microcarpa x Juglans regia TaxID=2249226 RepID=UPI001B7D96CB|nr:F-box protein At3g07870-like [Juglans microcarpa x Juglans regia]
MDTRENTCLEEVPGDVLVDIFCRLPMKTLVQCRGVCKEWQDLLSSPIFVSFHLSRSVTALATGVSPDCLFFEHLSREDNVMVTKLGMEFDFNGAASLNGLICSWNYREKRVSVSNPIIGKRITLPESQKEYGISHFKPMLRIGISPETGLYKVLKIQPRRESRSKTKWAAEICTLGVGAVTWRNIADVPQKFLFCTTLDGTFFNGAFHFIFTRDSPEFNDYICSFDFDNEKFQSNLEQPSPPLDNEECPEWLGLGVLTDCLSVSNIYGLGNGNPDIEVWVMKEYGVTKSWTKVFALENPMETLSSPSGFKIIKFLETIGIHSRFFALLYVPSFVWLEDVEVGESSREIEQCLSEL